MSAMGHKRTLKRFRLTSALPPKADIAERDRDVRFVPKADSCAAAIYAAFRTSIAGFLPVADVG
jgi:hypothetical protein